MKERISKGIFWFISIGVMLLGLIISGIFFFVNRQMFLQVIIIPIFGIALNPLLLDRVGRRINVEINYFNILAFSSVFLGATVALVAVTFIFLTVYSKNTNLIIQNFESILKIVIYFIYCYTFFEPKCKQE